MFATWSATVSWKRSQCLSKHNIMVLDTISSEWERIQIQDYILDKYTPAKVVEPTLQVVFHEDHMEKEILPNSHHAQLKCNDLSFPFEKSPPVMVAIKSCKVLVDPNDSDTTVKKVLEVSLEVSHAGLLPGDTIGIIPSNTKADVDFVLLSINLLNKADTPCSLQLRIDSIKKTAKKPQYVPDPSTPMEILRDCLALRSVPKKHFLSMLANCCNDQLQKRFLSCLSSKEGSSYYNDLIRKGLTFLEVLRLCPSCRPTLSLLCEQLPRLQPRPYSIASSPLANNDVKIIFSLLPERPGITTSMLENLCKKLDKANSCFNPSINMYFRHCNKFRYSEEDAENDNILIGVGTGVAPFLGFLEQKKQLKDVEDLTHDMGNIWLFIGAKTHYSAFGRQIFQKYIKNGTLQRYFEAFSQVKDWPSHYVQDLLKSNSMDFVEFLLKPKTILYVCADGAHISKSIEASIKQCLMQELQFDDSHAGNLITEFRSSGKYREDLWV